MLRFAVTGASSGIGRGTASALAKRGHQVWAIARNQDRLTELKNEFGDCVRLLSADLSEVTERQTVIDKLKSLDKLDGITHSAGSLIEPVAYRDLDVEKLAGDMSVHVATPIALNNALHENLTDARIVYIDSYSAIDPRNGWAAYSIIKAAAQMAARAAAEECTNSTIIRIFPGAVHTPLVDSVLASANKSPVVENFKTLASRGEMNDAAAVGEFIANVLLNTTAEQLSMREFWEYDNPDDQIF